MKGRLRNKILLFMVAVSVIPVMVAGFLSTRSIILSHKEDVASIESALIEQKRTEIENFVANKLEEIRFVITFQEDTEIGGVRLDSQLNLLASSFYGIDSFKEMSFISLDGIETVRLTRDYPLGVLSENLRDQSHLHKFQEAVAGRDYVGSVYYTLNGPAISLAVPVRDRGGRMLLVSSGETGLGRLTEILKSAKIGDTGYAYLVDEEGIVIGGGMDEETPLAGVRGIGIVNSVISGEDFLGGEKQERYKNFAGEEVIAAGKFLPGLGWGLIAEWPVAEADASVNRILYNNLLVLVAVVVAVVLASILLSNIIVRPIRKLQAGTERVSEGKFEEGIAIETGDELEELGESFNKMMAGLKRLEELKEEFVFVAAHELRTPVAAMKGYLSLVLDGTTGTINDKTKDFIEKVLHANERLVQLVNDLLEVSRSEAGRLTIKVSSVDPAVPIKEVLSELEKMADEKKVKLVYDAPPGLTKILADPDRIKEIMINLVGNSIKYMGGPGTVTISHELTTSAKGGSLGAGSSGRTSVSGGNSLITHIKDTGLGMSKEAQAKLFEKFYRVATDKTKNITGTGLGLFIVKEIIGKMGGKISAHSEGEGKGSTFSFSLPVAT